MPSLLLEIFSEEIPARMQKAAQEHLVKSLEAKLGKSGQGFSSPRRIAAVIDELPAMQPDVSQELKGPKTNAPEKALEGFLKKTGLSKNQLEKRDGVYFATIEQKGRPTADVLKESIEEILQSFPWPKSMRWGSGDITWVRPIHSILCIFDGKVVPVEFAGIKADNVTYGHRFLAPKAITVKKAADYEKALEKAFVLADREKRKTLIRDEAEKLATASGCHVKQNEGLLEEVTGLVEWPVLLAGTIDGNYMDLPEEVLVSEMRAHQKYFALEKDGALADTFLITANIKGPEKAIIAGNERVLRARLADGRFFWDRDREKSLEVWMQDLKHVTFHAKVGTLWDKSMRLQEFAQRLVKYVPGAENDIGSVARAAELCKADLVSGMVGEFPELQGVMGRYYALHQKEHPAVSDAIRDHYLPLGPSSPVPTAPTSVCVALADKLDTLLAMFAIGEKPTGSKDPFALRRAALGVIRILLENDIRLPLGQVMLQHSAHVLADVLVELKKEVNHTAPSKNDTVSPDFIGGIEGKSESTVNECMAFFHDRLIVQLKDQGIRHDVIKAVVADGDDDLLRISMRASAVQEFLDSEDGRNLLAGYKRAANIVAIEEKKDKAHYDAAVDEKLLSEQPEIKLAKALAANRTRIDRLFKEEKFTDMMGLLAELRQPVDEFFDKIMVNSDKKELRANRLRLLTSIRSSMDNVANFGLIEG